MKWPPDFFSSSTTRSVSARLCRPDGNDGLALAQRSLVPGHRRQLVHQAELHRAPEPRDEAVPHAGRVELLGVRGALVHLDRGRFDAGGATRSDRPVRRRAVVEHRHDLSVRVADEARHAPSIRSGPNRVGVEALRAAWSRGPAR